MSNDAAARRSAAEPLAPAPPVVKQPAQPSRWLPLWAWIEVVFWVSIIYLVRSWDAFDRAIANIVTLVGGFLALMPIFIWFSFYSGYGRRLRSAVFYGALLAVAAAIACLKIVSVTGELVPKFQWRWTPAPDLALVPAAHPAKGAEPAKDDQPTGVDLAATTPDDYPQFLGPQRNCWLAGPKLDRDWAAHPPRLLWKQPIGAGWSAFSVVNGFAVTQEQRGPEELVSCYEVLTGKLRWSHSDETRHETTLGGVGPRGTPTIHDGRVYTLGATGILHCLEGSTGKPLWTHNLLEQYGLTPVTDMESIAWGRAASPLVVDELVVVPAGGPAGGRQVSLVAFQKDTGKRVWEGGDDQIAYASPTVALLGGVRQILSVNEKTVTGHDLQSGQVLWSFPWAGTSNQNASTSEAVAVGDDEVFISKGYTGGAALFQVHRNDQGHWNADSLWSDTRAMKTKLTNVVIRQDHVYGLSDGTLECIELSTGKRRWKKGRYGHGQILGVDDLLIVLSEAGELFLVELTPDGHHELGHIPAIEGKTWNNPALYGNLLLVRNGEQAACFELKKVEE